MAVTQVDRGFLVGDDQVRRCIQDIRRCTLEEHDQFAWDPPLRGNALWTKDRFIDIYQPIRVSALKGQ